VPGVLARGHGLGAGVFVTLESHATGHVQSHVVRVLDKCPRRKRVAASA
jgi:hypothetical protein